ncbi:MAG: tetratricopeptide repeat protein [Candidatus Zixiibacteriota bacterium]|nr:MAG: tetratricopeptide repeat protein [candidate division Zixibacteria bacterium]
MLDTVVFVDSSVIDFFLNDAVLAKVHAEEDTVSTQSLKISAYPTAVLIGSDGVEIDRVIGYEPPEEYLKKLKDYLAGIGTLDDLLARAETDSSRDLYFEIADKYKYRSGLEGALSWYHKVIEAGEPLDSMSGESRIAIADMYRRAKDWEKTIDEFKAIEKDFEGTGFGMDAVIYQAISYRRMGDTAMAIATFEDYIERFPDSEDVDYATRQVDKLKEPETKGE